MIFELATGDHLYDPESEGEYQTKFDDDSRDENHLALQKDIYCWGSEN